MSATLESLPPGVDPQTILSHSAFIRRLVQGLLRDEHRVDDVVQQTLLTMMLRPPRGLGSRREWLSNVARNFALRLLRAEARRTRREHAVARGEAAVPSTSEVAHAHETQRDLIETVLALRDPYRRTVLLRYFDGLSVKEIARRERVPYRTVQTRMRRSLAMLRRTLDQRHGGRQAWCLPLLRLFEGLPCSTPAAGGLSPAQAGSLLPIAAARVHLPAAALLVGLLTLWVLHAVSSREGVAADSGPRLASPAAGPREPAPSQPVSDPGLLPTPRSPADALGSLLLRVVWGRDGTPAAGVGIRLCRQEMDNPHLHMQEAVSDEDGMAVFARLRPGRFTFWTDRGYRNHTTVAIDGGTPVKAKLTIPSGIDVEGTVVDETGAAVSGASVYLPDLPEGAFEWDRGAVMATTRADGSFEIRSVSDQRLVAAHARGRAESDLCSLSAPEGQSCPVRIVLSGPGSEVAGLVVDLSGRPLAGAVVETGRIGLHYFGLADARHRRGPKPVRTRTDEHGRFRIAGLRPGETPIALRAPGLATWHGSFVASPRRPAEIVVKLAPGATLEGRIATEDGKPSDRTEVYVGGPRLIDVLSTVTRSDGSYRIEGVPPGETEIAAAGGDRGAAHAVLRVGRGETLRWNPVLARARLAGRLVDERGDPVPAANVLAKTGRGVWVNAQSDGGGRFELPRALPGWLHLEIRERCSWIPSLTVDVAPQSRDVLLVLKDTTRASVKVRGAIHRPVSEDPLELSFLHLDTGALSRTAIEGGRDGDCTHVGSESADLPIPPGRMAVQCRGVKTGLVFSASKSLAPGEDWDFGPAQLEQTGTLALHVRRDDGVALEPGLFGVVREDGTMMEPIWVDGRGSARVQAAPGRYRLQVRGGGLADRSVPFETRSSAETTLQVVATAGARRVVRFSTRQGSPRFHTLRALLSDDAHTIVADLPVTNHDESRFSDLHLGLEPGRYRLEATANFGLTGSASFVVTGGDDPSSLIEIELR